MNKNKNIILIVSDKFINYHELEYCITYSDILELIEGNKAKTPEVLLIGQGISEEQIAFLNAKIREKNCPFIIHDSSHVNDGTANKKETHKSNKENVLISSPKRNENLFEMNLLVNEKGELLQDHITGFHLQGMLLIEAARQVFLAVTEKFYYSDELPSSHYFVINSMNTKYLAFVFALETNIEYTVVEHVNAKGRQRFCGRIDFKQNDVICTSVDVDFTVFDAQKLNQKEFELANNAIRSACNSSSVINPEYTKAG